MNPVASLFHEDHKLVLGLASILPSTTTPAYVSMKNYSRMAVVILAKNATTVTGSAITLKQATSVGAGSEKPLAFSTVYANVDPTVNDTLVETVVNSNTFTTNAVNSKNPMYVINVDAAMLDVDGGFDCVRAGTGDATATAITVLYILYPVTGNPSPSAVTN